MENEEIILTTASFLWSHASLVSDSKILFQ